ncbi:MAG TPA: methyltransferase domain-containing protein, partial [Povalibacter sp.]|nr:methyltransferase domain-containing protein [Povalibacter sp.]
TVVACHQGLQFFADKGAALTEMRRVLEPGGRLAVATWRSVEEMPILRDLQSVAERHLGAILDRRHSEGHPARLEQLLAQLAFNEVKSEVVSKTVRFAEPSTFIGLNAMALVGMSGAAGALDNEERTRVVHQITEESLAAASRYIDAGALMFDIASNLVTARA